VLPPPVSHGVYLLAASVAAYIKHARSDRRFGEPGSRFREARTRRMEELAHKAMLDRKAREGELVAVADVFRGVDTAYQAMKARLLGIPTKLVPRLTANPQTNFRLTTEFIHEALDEISRWTFTAAETPKREAAE
jgi:hypothetical protein